MFAKRLLTVAILLPVFAAALLFLPRTVWALFLLPGLAIASAEWIGLAGCPAAARYGYAGAVGISALAILFLAGNSALEWWLFGAAAAFWLVVAPAWLLGALVHPPTARPRRGRLDRARPDVARARAPAGDSLDPAACPLDRVDRRHGRLCSPENGGDATSSRPR